MTPFVTGHEGGSYRAHGWFYDKGMVQPAVIAVMGEEVLYEWVLKPSLKNGGGKLKRQDPWEIWDYIERKLDRVRFEKGKREIGVGEGRSGVVGKVGEVEMEEVEDQEVLLAKEDPGMFESIDKGIGEDDGYLKSGNEVPLNPDTLTSTEAELLAAERVVPIRDTSEMKSVPPRGTAVGVVAAGVVGAGVGVGAIKMKGEDDNVDTKDIMDTTDVGKESVSEPGHLEEKLGATTNTKSIDDVRTEPLGILDEDMMMNDQGEGMPTSAVTVGDDTLASTPPVQSGRIDEAVDEKISREIPVTTATDDTSPSGNSGPARTSAGVLIHSVSEEMDVKPKATRRSIAKELDMADDDDEEAKVATTMSSVKDVDLTEPRTVVPIVASTSGDTSSPRATTDYISEPRATTTTPAESSMVENKKDIMTSPVVEPSTETDVGETAYTKQPTVEKRRSLTFADKPEIVPETDDMVKATGVTAIGGAGIIADVESSPVGASSQEPRPGSTISMPSRDSMKDDTETGDGEDLYGGEVIKDEYEDLADPIVDDYASPVPSTARSSKMRQYDSGASTSPTTSPARKSLLGSNSAPAVVPVPNPSGAGEMKRMNDTRAGDDEHGVYEEYDGYEEVVAEEVGEEEEEAGEEAEAVFTEMQEGDEYVDSGPRDVEVGGIGKSTNLERDMSRDAHQSVDGSSDVQIIPVTGALGSPVSAKTPQVDEEGGKVTGKDDVVTAAPIDNGVGGYTREDPDVPAMTTEAERRSIEADMDNDEQMETGASTHKTGGPLATVKNAGRKVAWFWGLDRFLTEHKLEGTTNDGEQTRVHRTASSGGYRDDKTKKLTRKNTLGAAINRITGRHSMGDEHMTTSGAHSTRQTSSAAPAMTEAPARQGRIHDEMDAAQVKKKSSFVGRLSGSLHRSSHTSDDHHGETLGRKDSITSKLASPGKALLAKLSVSYGEGPQAHRQSFQSTEGEREGTTQVAEDVATPTRDGGMFDTNADTPATPLAETSRQSPERKTLSRFLPSKMSGGHVGTEGRTNYQQTPHADTEEDVEEIQTKESHHGPGITEMDAGEDGSAKVKRKNTLQVLKDGGKKFAWFWGIDGGKKKDNLEGTTTTPTASDKKKTRARRSNSTREGKTGGLFNFRRNKSENAGLESTRNSTSTSPSRRVSRVKSMFGRS